MNARELSAIIEGLHGGAIVPYLGPQVLALEPGNHVVPISPELLVQKMTAKVSVPHKIRNNLTAAAQFIENFKHRKTVVNLMTEAFAAQTTPTMLHEFLASLPELGLVVDVWYDATMAAALRHSGHASWGQIQGLSQAEHFGHWTQAFGPDGVAEAEPERWQTVLYKPLGSISPAKNFLVSDSDFVEVLTEIDIQTPIPVVVQDRRVGRNFLFLGCRFSNQLERTYARQVMKRSSARHWAVLPETPTKNELRFMEEQNIQRLEVPLQTFVDDLIQTATPGKKKWAVNT